MQPLVAGVWGAFFGTAVLMFAGAVAAFVRGLRRVALMAGSASILFMSFAATYLGLIPFPDVASRLRAQGTVFIFSAVLLGHLVFAMIGYMREPQLARRRRTALYGYGIVVSGTSFLLPAPQGFDLTTVASFLVGATALVLCIYRAFRGDRLAGIAMLGVVSICTSAASLTWIASGGNVSVEVNAVGAVAGMVYLCVIAVVLWMRFSYLFELQQVIQHGSAYDPITRMRTHSETGNMVGLAFFDHTQDGAQVGVLAVSIGNLLLLERLHGRAAVNHGLFVSAGRLRRSLPGETEAGRIGEDGFLVLVRNVDKPMKLAELGREIVERLSRPVALSTSADPGELESGQANWVAQVGVGIVVAGSDVRPSEAIAKARTMSRAAWGFPSRVAWQDSSGHVAEAPQLASA